VEGVTGVAEARFLHSRSEAGIAYDVVVSDLVGMKHLWVVPFGVDPDLAKVLYRERWSARPVSRRRLLSFPA